MINLLSLIGAVGLSAVTGFGGLQPKKSLIIIDTNTYDFQYTYRDLFGDWLDNINESYNNYAVSCQYVTYEVGYPQVYNQLYYSSIYESGTTKLSLPYWLNYFEQEVSNTFYIGVIDLIYRTAGSSQLFNVGKVFISSYIGHQWKVTPQMPNNSFRLEGISLDSYYGFSFLQENFDVSYQEEPSFYLDLSIYTQSFIHENQGYPYGVLGDIAFFDTLDSTSMTSAYRVTYDVFFSKTSTILSGNSTSSEEYNSGYSDGYNVGYNEGDNTGYIKGVEYGYDLGISEGYQDGYIDGYNEAGTQDSVASTIFTGIIDVGLLPVNFFLSCLNFEVFGVNIGGFVSALLTVAIIVIVIRMVMGAKQSND